MIPEPLFDRVLIKRETIEMYKGVIHLPDNRVDKPQVGTVHAVGKGKVLDDGTVIPPAVRVGEKIMFGKYSGTDLKIEETEFVIMKETDILLVLHEEGQL